MLTVPRAASADQQGSVQAQISALRNELASTGQQVHQLTSSYAEAEVRVNSLAQQLSVEQAQAQRAAARVTQTGAALRQELVTAYVGGFSQPSVAAVPAITGGDIDNPSVRYGYLSIATSSMHDSVDSYRTAQLNLNSALSALAAEEHSAQTAAAAADRARQSALDEAGAANTRLGALQAQLTALERRAAAQRAAAGQAAVAGQAGAARSSAVAQGGPVNGGLLSLVRAQVAAPAPARPTAPAPATSVPATTTSAATTTPILRTPATTTTVPPPPPPPPAASQSGSGDVWLQLRECESGDDYQANTGNGFYGAYQFSAQTWTNLGYPGRPDQEPPAMQDQAAQKLQAESGWDQWPACSAALGLS